VTSNFRSRGRPVEWNQEAVVGGADTLVSCWTPTARGVRIADERILGVVSQQVAALADGTAGMETTDFGAA